MLGARATTIIVYIVTGIWAINFGAGLFVTGYEPDQAINGIFMALVGGLLALKRKDDDKSPPSGGTPK